VRCTVALVFAACTMLVAAASGCARPAQSAHPAPSGAVRSSPAADWPTGASVDATVALRLPDGSPRDTADVALEVFGDQALSASLARQLGSTLFHADISEPRRYLTAAVRVDGAARSGRGVDVYASVYEQWWRRGASGPEKAVASSGPAVLRLRREGSAYELSSVDRPGDGSLNAPGLAALFPAWVRDSVQMASPGGTEHFMDGAALQWSREAASSGR
jgi:hypothetical protein